MIGRRAAWRKLAEAWFVGKLPSSPVTPRQAHAVPLPMPCSLAALFSSLFHAATPFTSE